MLCQDCNLQNMKKNKDILITKLDEGNGLVDLKVYDNTIQEIISDTSKFEKLNKDPTLRCEASLQCFLRKLKQNFFNEIEYDKLYHPGSAPAPARIYGNPKIHKLSSIDTFPKLCLIVSSIGTFDYDLVCFCCDRSFVLPDDYSCKDNFSFAFQIKNANLSAKFLVSYIVTSLFTNIPWLESIDIAINKSHFQS